VNRVRLVMQPQDLGRSGSYVAVTQSPKPIRKHWGPSRRDAPHGAHSTPAPEKRDGVTARHNPTPPACEPAHRGLKGRQADGTARVRPRSNRGRSSDAVSGAVQGDSVSVRRRNPPHPSRGSRTEHEPEYAHAAESCLRRTHGTTHRLSRRVCLCDPERAVGETASSSGFARLLEGASLPLCERRGGCH